MKAFNLVNSEWAISEIDVVIDSPVDYEKGYKRINHIVLQDVSVPVISVDDLIKMKKVSDREQDKADIRYLRKLKNEKSRSHRKYGCKSYESAEMNIRKEKLPLLKGEDFQRGKTEGFDYYLSNEAIKGYQEKPPELRLKWLYMGNLLRKGYSKSVIIIQNKFREGGF
jgi:hypothetical protein